MALSALVAVSALFLHERTHGETFLYMSVLALALYAWFFVTSILKGPTL